MANKRAISVSIREPDRWMDHMRVKRVVGILYTNQREKTHKVTEHSRL